MSATPALAELTGGTSATGTAAPVSAPAKPAPAIRASPVTARSANIAYTGPVFQRTASGEVIPYTPLTPAGSVNPSGGIAVGVAAETKPQLLVPGSRARYVGGLAAAPMSAPPAVAEIVWAANQIIGLPYIFGGGHGSFESPGYDCSGTVSYALHGGRLLSVPADSSEFMRWGSHGLGRWVTIFSNPGHAYVDVAGLRLDTSAADDPTRQQGPRWRPLRRNNGGYTVRHPLGY
jgi:cell wall-associated NlpC family hydrolase